MQSLKKSSEAIQFPLRFNSDALLNDLNRISDERWIPHFNTDNYEGDWSAVALRGPANVTHPIQEIFATPGTTEWANTSLFDDSPYFAKVMSTFKCPLLSVRLLRLGPGASIKEHTDHSLAFEDGEVRLHVPVQTNQDVKFWLNGQLIPLQAGETWYLNVNLPHRVENNSLKHRVHLVIDCEVNSWLIEQAGITG